MKNDRGSASNKKSIKASGITVEECWEINSWESEGDVSIKEMLT
jgi:hypothetical protein